MLSSMRLDKHLHLTVNHIDIRLEKKPAIDLCTIAILLLPSSFFYYDADQWTNNIRNKPGT